MNTTDIALFESGGSGDFSIVNDDLLMGESLYQQIYLALFGGNLEADTKQVYTEKEERFDYWGNSLIWNDVKSIQFNSQTERTIQNNALNSSGRLAIMQAVDLDLHYLSSIITYEVDVSIISAIKLSIIVNFTEKTNQQDRTLVLIYDNAKKEIIIDKTI
jgi:phage gp46-like protein